MTQEQFCQWLSGFAEINSDPPTAEQWAKIKKELASVATAPGPIYIIDQRTPRLPDYVKVPFEVTYTAVDTTGTH